MGTRREARELALQALYQLDLTGEGDPAVALFWSHFDAERTEAERESARVGRRGPGASEARRARSARALDGPPESINAGHQRSDGAISTSARARSPSR